MRCPAQKSTGKQSANTDSALAKPLAPEDVRRGDFVALLHVTYEFPSFFWDCDAILLPHDQPMRMLLIPDNAGLPLKVKSVCLPFVLAKSPAGERKTLDLRKCRLARLDRAYANTAWRACRKADLKAAKHKS